MVKAMLQGRLKLAIAIVVSLWALYLLTLIGLHGVQAYSTQKGFSTLKHREDRNAAASCSDAADRQGEPCNGHLLATLFQEASNSDSIFSPTKMSFARRLNENIYVAGQLTPRQIKYAADSGFKSVLSVFDHEGQTSPDGRTLVISTAEEKVLVEQVAGMKFFKLLSEGEGLAWYMRPITAVERMTNAFPHLQFPALLHCNRGVSITLITLLYYANQTAHDPSFQPRVDIRRLYEILRVHGLDFVNTRRQTITTMEAITREDLPDDVKTPIVSLPNWADYWQSRPVYYNWYASGQINSNELDTMKNTGFVTVVNLRGGVTTSGRPTQEAVELINIASGTPTYATSTQPARQSVEGLRSNVLDRSRPNTYVSPTSSVNYESENHEEFGDSVGYNETWRGLLYSLQDWTTLMYLGVRFYSESNFGDLIEINKDHLINISEKGAVLVHGDSPQRAAYVAVLMAAVQYDLSFDWSLQRLWELGHGISATEDADIYDVYREYLLPNGD